jgi:hypothetical protein
VVYCKLGLAPLRTAWFNLDAARAIALVAAGVLTPATWAAVTSASTARTASTSPHPSRLSGASARLAVERRAEMT